MNEIFLLLILGVIWLGFASVHDLRKKIVFNWLSFSLIIFALGFRFLYSLFNSDFSFFYQGIFALGIFFVIGNLFYYARVFAGGDAKLMIALGPLLALSTDFNTNLEIFALFFILFLFSAAVYGIGWSFYFSLTKEKEIRKEFKTIFNKNKKVFFILTAFALLLVIAGFSNEMFFYLGLMLFVFPYLYIYSKSIDKTCLVKSINTKSLQEGDLLFRNVKLGKKIIKAEWEGLSLNQIKEIQKKHKFVEIREGIPFVPVFFVSFLLLVYFWYFNLLDLFFIF